MFLQKPNLVNCVFGARNIVILSRDINNIIYVIVLLCYLCLCSVQKEIKMFFNVSTRILLLSINRHEDNAKIGMS